MSSDNGTNSKIVESKTEGHLDSEEFREARVDLLSKGEEPTSDTHYHNNVTDDNGNIIELGKATPSEKDKDQKNNVGNTKPCVVLGYYDGSVPNLNQTGGSPSPIKPVQAIGFYNTQGSIGRENGYNFSSFVKLINKINKDNGK